ncbi:RnfH family protein [Celerinatantimonas sp. YJH-8]|uniref:RnfH family protein n=1 Tax=Celerinatantimonas sp. YJH-8 TaxID=3228714 RepID=UPI0038C61191
MKISVAHAAGADGKWVQLDVEEPTTIAQAIEQSSLLTQFSELSLTTCKVGIYGKICSLEQPVKEGDRVEIYKPLQRVMNDDDDEDDDDD